MDDVRWPKGRKMFFEIFHFHKPCGANLFGGKDISEYLCQYYLFLIMR